MSICCEARTKAANIFLVPVNSPCERMNISKILLNSEVVNGAAPSHLIPHSAGVNQT